MFILSASAQCSAAFGGSLVSLYRAALLAESTNSSYRPAQTFVFESLDEDRAPIGIAWYGMVLGPYHRANNERLQPISGTLIFRCH